MKKLKIIGLFILIVIGVFACSKKNEQQQNINAENLQQPQEQKEIEVKVKENNTFSVDELLEGDKYYILESSVNIRSQPNLTSSVIGKLELHSEIEIIEKSENFQTIDGFTNYWYKIRYEDITGYIWGGFISIGSSKTRVFEIDGTKIYCYFRRQNYKVLPSDIFIYINQKRISNTAIEKVYSEDLRIRSYWEYCFFSEKDDNIILSIESMTTTGSTFSINKYGEIKFIENSFYGG
jgi:hypothetical protein